MELLESPYSTRRTSAPFREDRGTRRQLVAALARLGYRSYFAGVTHFGAVFVPLTGDFWDDAMEVCRDPGPHRRVCWHDILSTRSDGAEDRAIRAAPAPGRWKRSVAICDAPSSTAELPRHVGAGRATSQRTRWRGTGGYRGR